MECVADVFHHLGNRERCFADLTGDFLVQLAQRRKVSWIIGSQNGNRRIQEVSHGRPFAGELWIGANRKVNPHPFSAGAFDGGDDLRLCSTG